MTNQVEDINKSPNINELIERGNKIYEKIQRDDKIEATFNGQYIAIDVASGQHFIGETREAAMQAGQAKLPNVVFFIRRIGSIDIIARHCPYPVKQQMVHARIL